MALRGGPLPIYPSLTCMQSTLHWSTSSPTPLSHKLLLSHLLSWVGTLVLFYKLHLSIFVIEICKNILNQSQIVLYIKYCTGCISLKANKLQNGRQTIMYFTEMDTL